MRSGFWLAIRELWERRWAFVLATAVLSSLGAFFVVMELLWVAEMNAITAQIDRMGPAVRVVPQGRTALDLARFTLGNDSFSLDELATLQRGLSPWVRAIEGRLLVRLDVQGIPSNIIGMERQPAGLIENPLAPNEAAMGAGLGETLGLEPGSKVRLRGHSFTLAATLPPSGGPEDHALLVPLNSLRRLLGRDDGVNEIRLFTRPETSMDDLNSQLTGLLPGAGVIIAKPEGAGRVEIVRSMRGYRWVVFVVMAAMMTLTVLIWAHLGAEERRRDTATLVALGCPWTTILLTRITPAVGMGLVGTLGGYGIGVLMASAQALPSVVPALWSSTTFLSLFGVSVLSSAIGMLPLTAFSMLADQAAELQREI